MRNVNAESSRKQKLSIIKFLSGTIGGSLASVAAIVSQIVNLSVEERRQIQQRAVGAAACAAAAAYGAPQIAEHATEQHQSQAFLEHAAKLADALNTEQNGDGLTKALDLSRPWAQQVSYDATQFAATDLLPTNVQTFVDLMTDLDPRDNLETVSSLTTEADCMAEAIYYEARSESLAGQLAVTEVVMNRVASDFYPNSVCGVVYQGSTRRTGCQFSFTCDGSMDYQPRGDAWDRAQHISAHVLTGGARSTLTGDATHYHTDYVSPYWHHGLVKTKTIGTHIFYRFPETGREWAAARHRQQIAFGGARPGPGNAIRQASLTTEELQARELERLEEKDV